MRAVYKKDGYTLKSDFSCNFVPYVGDEVVIGTNTYQVIGRKLDLDDNEVVVNLKRLTNEDKI